MWALRAYRHVGTRCTPAPSVAWDGGGGGGGGGNGGGGEQNNTDSDHAYGAADRSTGPAPDLVLFLDSTFRETATFRDLVPRLDLMLLLSSRIPHQPADQRSSVAVCDQGQW